MRPIREANLVRPGSTAGRRRGPAKPKPKTPKIPPMPPGLAARRLAVRLVAGVLVHNRPFDQVLAETAARPEVAALEARDRAFARAVAAAVLRRQGELEHVLNAFLERPLPADKGYLWPILLTGAAQLVCLELPAHAVVDLAVETTRRDRAAHRFAKLTNAVLRRVAERGAQLLGDQDRLRLNIPGLAVAALERDLRRGDSAPHRRGEPEGGPLDISAKADAAGWAERLGGRLLPTGTIRLAPGGRIEELAGYAEGAWWVQDAAAALVTRVAGDVAGKSVADLCAAPGGKTASLVAGGAHVTAIDVSAARLSRLRENLQRLHLAAEVLEADAATWSPGRTFDVVILDAPCTATGTIRRHPDILRLKRPEDVARMAGMQRAMLAHAATLVAPGGTLVYSTCSLEPEEGQDQVEAFLGDQQGSFERVAITAPEIGGEPEWITPAGDLRTLPFHMGLEPDALAGMDAFHVARLRRRA